MKPTQRLAKNMLSFTMQTRKYLYVHKSTEISLQEGCSVNRDTILP